MNTTHMARSGEQASGSPWQSLYTLGGAAALVMTALIPIQALVYILWPPPNTVQGWFSLFQENGLIGLLDMDLLLMVDQVLMALIFLALYFALRTTKPARMALVLMLELLGIAIYFASTVAFEMLSISKLYAAATTEAERAVYLAAGNGVLATWQGSAFNFSYVMEGAAGLLASLTMLQSPVFSRKTAWAGILMGVLALVPPTAGPIGFLFAFLSLIPLVIWNVLMGLTLIRLGRGEKTAESQAAALARV